jgi:putative membrane protein
VITTKKWMLVVTTALLGMSLVNPIFPDDQLLHHLPTGLAIGLLAVDIRKRMLVTSSFVGICIFIWIHILGARYTYSHVPYDAWCEQILGSSPKAWFGFERNHYDRFVHFSFGALCTWPVGQLLERFFRIRRGWSMTLGVVVVLAIGGFYEIIEWIIGATMSPESAEAYNGQQGDVWDPQKDMAVAILGSLLSCAIVALCAPRSPPRPRAS